MSEDDLLVVRDVSDLRQVHHDYPETRGVKYLFLPRLAAVKDGRRYHGDVYFTTWAQQHPEYPEVANSVGRSLLLMRKGGQIKCLAS